jgi:FkbM family methyltransferase
MLSYLHRKIRNTPWLGRLALNLIPDVRFRVNVNPLGPMVIRLRQHRGYWLRAPLTHEQFMLGSLERFIRKGDVVFDAGANIGLYSRFMVQRFQASHVYAFEPIPSNRLLIAENLKIVGCSDKVTILPCALGDQDGTASFQVDDLTSNSGTLDAVAHGSASQSRRQYGLPPVTVEVAVSRLDTLVETNTVAKPDVIKLDVEGAEAMTLDGARKSLLNHRPRLVVELHGPEAARGVLKVLWEIGFYCFGRLSMDGAKTYNYKELTPADLESITGPYSLQYLVASANRADLAQPVEDFVV